MLRFSRHIVLFVFFTAILTIPGSAWAYIGPGTGLSALGAFLAVVFGVIIAILGFLWYPIKRLMKKKSKEPEAITGDDE